MSFRGSGVRISRIEVLEVPGMPAATDVEDFEASSEWSGPRRGCSFKLGEKGLGYYRDAKGLQTLRCQASPAPKTKLGLAQMHTGEADSEEEAEPTGAGEAEHLVPGPLAVELGRADWREDWFAQILARQVEKRQGEPNHGQSDFMPRCVGWSLSAVAILVSCVSALFITMVAVQLLVLAGVEESKAVTEVVLMAAGLMGLAKLQPLWRSFGSRRRGLMNANLAPQPGQVLGLPQDSA